MLKDLMLDVSRLKLEYSRLSEESRELMQEKYELREEKASLKSDIESLIAQYPIPVTITQGPISVHPPLQPSPFFGTQNPTEILNPCSGFVPYSPSVGAPTGQASVVHPSFSDASNRQDSNFSCRKINHSDVALELELKTPDSSEQDISRNEKKGKESPQKERCHRQ